MGEMTDHSAYSSQVGMETVSISVAFIGASVQGPQNLLEVEWAQCMDGCTPKITGIDLESYGPALSSVIEATAAASATTTRASASASRATPASSARSRPRSCKRLSGHQACLPTTVCALRPPLVALF